MNNYDLATWLIETRNILAQRESVKKADALLEITENIEYFIELFKEGNNPMEAYLEYINL